MSSVELEQSHPQPYSRDERGVGIGLDGKILAEAGIPGKGFANGFHVGANSRLVVEVEWGRVAAGDVDQLVLRDKRSLHGKLLG